jgi:hypothetical protein
VKIVIACAILIGLFMQGVKMVMAHPPQRGDPATAAPGAPELTALVVVLGSDTAIANKREASRKLVESGKVAIPLLIGALHDSRVYERRDIANRMNLPATSPPPAPVIATITVGQRCEDLLYQIVTPAYSSPSAGNFKVYSEQILKIDDWGAWWAANQQKTLAEIHKDLQPLVDEYWKRHGTTQKVRIQE